MRTPAFLLDMALAAILLCAASAAPAERDGANPAPLITKLSIAELAERLDALRAASRDGRQTPNLEMVLAELIRRGGAEVEHVLSSRLEESRSELAKRRRQVEAREASQLPPEWHEWVEALERVGAEDLLILTALRRVQNKPDPLTVEIRRPERLTATTRELPLLEVALKSRDADKIPLLVRQGGDYRSGRQTRWRLEVREASGKLVPLRPSDEFGWTGGGIYRHDFLEHGETWETTLRMGNYVMRIPQPGEYTVRVLYHDAILIADLDDPDGLKNLILFASKPFMLAVSEAPKTVIQLEAASREKARKLIQELADGHPVKVIQGRYDESLHEFLAPESPAGQLLAMGWQAVPELLESLADDQTSSGRRAWLLSLLYTITAEEDLDPTLARHGRVLGRYEARSRGCWMSVSGTLDPAAQRKLVSAWLQFQQEYLDFLEPDADRVIPR